MERGKACRPRGRFMGVIFGKRLPLGQRLESVCRKCGDVVVSEEAGKTDKAGVRHNFLCPSVWGKGSSLCEKEGNTQNSGNCLPKTKTRSVVSPSPWRGMTGRGCKARLGRALCQSGRHCPSREETCQGLSCLETRRPRQKRRS